MGALTYHEENYPTEWPTDTTRTLEIVTFNGNVEIRIGAAGDETPKNGRTSAILTKAETLVLIADLQRAADYLAGD